jgi:sterol desaturase/sphingolipid hydroxylase (fatty acid hydroxylase superfamily)
LEDCAVSYVISLMMLCLGLSFAMLLSYGCVRIAEIALPRTPFPGSSQLRSLRFWPYYIASSAFCAIVGSAIYTGFDLHPLITFGGETFYRATGLGVLNYIIWPVINLLIIDFFHYWKHRAQHRFFWKFHAVHHSIENLSAVNSYHHWSDPVFSLALATIPMAVIIGVDAPTFVVLTALIGAQGAFIHSNTKIHLGPAVRVLSDNRFHRIHHSVETRHFDRNFGERSTVWDQLFGTAYFPQKGEWPRTGIAEEPEPLSTDDYFWRPFRSPSQTKRSSKQPDLSPSL